jgi:threonyl-tRNA synthetase
MALRTELRSHGVRAEVDPSSNKINGKVLRAEEAKVHTMLVIGRRDLEAGALSVRVHGKGNLGAKPRAEVVSDLLSAIRDRRPNE